MKRRTQTLILLAVVGVVALGIQISALATITDDIDPQVAFISGNKMGVSLLNQGSQSASGTVIADVTVDGVDYSASAKFYLDPGQSTIVQLTYATVLTNPVGPAFTITDDIDPQHSR